MSAAMNVIRSWQARGVLPKEKEKRKRPTADAFFDTESGDPRKRAKADYEREQRTEEVVLDEYKIRGQSASTTGTGGGSGAPPSSQRGGPSFTRDSLLSPAIREHNQQTLSETSIFRSTPTSKSNRAPGASRQSPRSRNPEHFIDAATGPNTEVLPEQNQAPKNIRPPHSCPGRTELPRSSSPQLKQPKALRVDTTKTIDDLDPLSSGFTPDMAGEPLKDQRPSHSFSLKQAQPSYDTYPKSGSPLSRRPSESMAPPPSAGFKPVRSESSTPRTTTPVTTKELSLPKGNNQHSQVPLFENFNTFAQTIQSSASLITQRNLITQQLAVYERDRQRHQRYEGVFTTLLEDTETKYDLLGKSSATLELQVEQKSTDQAQISSALAGRMQAPERQLATDSSDPSRNEKDSGLREELTQLRIELDENRKDIKALRRKVVFQDELEQVVHKSDLEGVISQDNLETSLRGILSKARLVDKDGLDHYMTKYGLEPMEGKLAEHKAEIDRVDQKITDILQVTQLRKLAGEEAETRYTTSISRTQARLSEIESATGAVPDLTKDLSDLTTSLSSNQAKLSELEHATGMLPNLAKDLRELRVDLDVVKEQQAKPAEVKHAMGMLPNSGADLEDLAASISRIEVKVAQIEQATGMLPNLGRDLGDLREEFDALKEEQNGKDDTVSSDIEMLENQAKDQGENVAQLREEIRRVDAELGKQWNSLALITTSRPTQPPTPPMQSRAFTPQEPDRIRLQDMQIALQEHKNQTDALEMVFSAQQQKFDQLTSDHLVSCMVHQMMQIYPHHPNNLPNQVASVSAQVQNLGQRQNTVDQFIQTNLTPWRTEADRKLAACPTKNIQSLKTLDTKNVEFTQALNDTRKYVLLLNNRLNALQLEIDKQKTSEESNRITQEPVSLYEDQIKALAKRVDEVEAGQAKTAGAVAATVTSVQQGIIADRESSDEEPLSSRKGYSKDTTPLSAPKRKRHVDAVSLQNDESATTRRINAKGFRP